MTDHGTAAEDLVEDICQTIFLADFTVRSPMFKKGHGQQKEAADFLVPFEDTLLAFQVKSRRTEESDVDDQVRRGRILKRISEGIDQLKTIKRALAANRLSALRNKAGVLLPFQPTTIRNLVGLVIVDLPDEYSRPLDERTQLLNGFERRHGIPVHIMLASDFRILSKEVDTLPDFIAYLATREHYFDSASIFPHITELDFLATYKMLPDLRDPATRPDLLTIMDGMWTTYIDKHGAAIERRNKRQELSYRIDELIEYLHTLIGYRPYEIDFGRSDAVDDIFKYSKIAIELARLGRLQRLALCKMWASKMVRAEQLGLGYGLFLPRPNSGILVTASSERDRKERHRVLYALARMAYCHAGLSRLLAVGTEPIRAEQRSYDWVLLEDVTLGDATTLKQQAAEYFGAPEVSRMAEFEDEG